MTTKGPHIPLGKRYLPWLLSGLPPTAFRYVRWMAAFGVAAAIGMAPLLGKLRVPFFEPLLQLLTEELQGISIPISSLLMGILAVAVQFYSDERIVRRSLKKRFGAVLIAVVISLLAFITLRTKCVVAVPVEDWTELVVIGWSREAGCMCGPDDVKCIKDLAFQIGSCWSEGAQENAKLALQIAYLCLMGGFGALVGLLVLQDTARRQRLKETRTAASELSSPAESRPAATDDPVEKLRKLKEMLDLGLISQKDFNAKKRDLLSKL